MYTVPHSDATLVCRGPLPVPFPTRVPVFVDLSCLCLSSLSLADLVPGYIPAAPIIVLAGGPSVSHDRASAVFFV